MFLFGFRPVGFRLRLRPIKFLFRLRLNSGRLIIRRGRGSRRVTRLAVTVSPPIEASPVFTSGAALIMVPTLTLLALLTLLTLLALLTLLTLLALILLAFAIVAGVDNTVVVIGVLKVVFRSDPISGRISIAAEGQILIEELLSRAAQLVIGAAALKALILGRGTPLAVVAGAAPIGIGIMFHGAYIGCLHIFPIFAHT